MKEDNISQLGDYDPPFCEQHTYGSCHICMFKFKSFDQLTLFDMGFFEPSVMGGGGHEVPPS